MYFLFLIDIQKCRYHSRQWYLSLRLNWLTVGYFSFSFTFFYIYIVRFKTHCPTVYSIFVFVFLIAYNLNYFKNVFINTKILCTPPSPWSNGPIKSTDNVSKGCCGKWFIYGPSLFLMNFLASDINHKFLLN